MNGNGTNGLYGDGQVGPTPARAAWDEASAQLAEVRDRKRAASKHRLDVEAVERWQTLEREALARERRAAQTALFEQVRAEQADTLRAELLAHYDGLGPLYPLYVERLVQATVRAAAYDALGETLEAAAHIKAADEVRKCGASLQRYTESLKQEIIAKRVEAQVVRVVEIIEAVVLPVAPQLWNDVIAALADRAPSLE